MNTTTPTAQIEFTRIDNDVNGNPRYVCHFNDLLTADELNDYSNGWLNRRYRIAVARANKIGGKKFHNKQYGGGIVFQSYNLTNTRARIAELLATGK
jgi:hypothetical protein